MNLAEMQALRDQPIDEEVVAVAIAGVIQIARSQHQSLEELRAEVLEEDHLLTPEQRQWLSELVTAAWQGLPLETLHPEQPC